MAAPSYADRRIASAREGHLGSGEGVAGDRPVFPVAIPREVARRYVRSYLNKQYEGAIKKQVAEEKRDSFADVTPKWKADDATSQRWIDTAVEAAGG